MPKKGQARASKGMGSVRQRTDGRWEARFTTPDGRQRSIYGESESEVTKKLRKRIYELDTGAWHEPSLMTVAQWLDIWLSDYQSDNGERTIIKYKSIVNHTFKPEIGSIKIAKLSSIHIRHLISTLKSRGLSQVTISNYCSILHTAMNRAIEARLIKENPVSAIPIARGTVKKFHVVEVSQFPKFIEAAKETSFENELLFMLYTGLRVGELRGLRWSDIDFSNGTAFIHRQLHAKAQMKKQVTLPKYNEERLIYLAPEALTILRNQRHWQAEQRLASMEWVDDELSRDLVFRQHNGKPHSETTIFRATRIAGGLIGIPDLHPHDLRHSYAIAAIRAQIDVKTVQHNLGHKTSSMTMDVYVAYTEEAGKEGAARLSEYLKNVQREPV